MTTEKRPCLRLVRSIRTSRFRTSSVRPRSSARSTGKWWCRAFLFVSWNVSTHSSPSSLFAVFFFREKLCAHLPARAEGYSWSLVFSTSQHGFSLNSLYRKMHKLESPILIVIEDTDHNVRGSGRFISAIFRTIFCSSFTIIYCFRTILHRCLVRSRPARCTCRTISTAPANRCCTNLIHTSRCSIGAARICTSSRATRKAWRSVPESKCAAIRECHLE